MSEFIQSHGEKFKSRLKELSSRKRCQSIKPSLEKIKVYARGWLNYYGIASMKNNIEEINGWLYHRIRMCIWKQWKLPKTKEKKSDKDGSTTNTMRIWRQTAEEDTGIVRI